MKNLCSILGFSSSLIGQTEALPSHERMVIKPLQSKTVTPPSGFPLGSGDISSYTPTRVTIQSFSITSRSEYRLCELWIFSRIVNSRCEYFLVLGLPGLKRPQYEKILASRGRSIVTVVFQYSIIWWLRMAYIIAECQGGTASLRPSCH